MNIHYFVITDQVKSGELEIKYWPTVEMLADHFTKPLDGETFNKFRAQIMNMDHSHISTDLARNQALSFSLSQRKYVGNPSHHAKVCVSHAKDLMASVKVIFAVQTNKKSKMNERSLAV